MSTRPDDLMARMLALKAQQDVTKVAPPVAQRPPAPPLDMRGMSNVALNLYAGLRDAVNENPFMPLRLPDMGEPARPMPFTQTASYTAGNLLPDISDPVLGPFGELAKAGFKALPAGMLFAAPGGDWLKKAQKLLGKASMDYEGYRATTAAADAATQIVAHRAGTANAPVFEKSVQPSVIGGPRVPSEGEFLHDVRRPVQGTADIATADQFPYQMRDNWGDLGGASARAVLNPHEVGYARMKKFFGDKTSLFTLAALRGQNPGTHGGGSDFIKLLWEVEGGETSVENAAFLLRIPPEELTSKAIGQAIKDSKAFAKEGLQLLGIDLERPLLVWRGGQVPVTGTPVPVSLSRKSARDFDQAGVGERPYVVSPKRIQADVEYSIGNMADEREVLVFPGDLHPVTLADVGAAVYVRPEPNGLFSVAVHEMRGSADFNTVRNAKASGARYSPELSMSIAQTVPGKEFFPLVPGQVRPTQKPVWGFQRQRAQRQFEATQPMAGFAPHAPAIGIDQLTEMLTTIPAGTFTGDPIAAMNALIPAHKAGFVTTPEFKKLNDLLKAEAMGVNNKPFSGLDELMKLISGGSPP